MNVAIISSPSSFNSTVAAYNGVLDENGIDNTIIEIGKVSLDDALLMMKDATHLIFRLGHCDLDDQISKSILNTVEGKGVNVFPDFNTRWHFDDKVSQYALLKMSGFNVIDSFIFYSKSLAISSIDDMAFPVVWKLKKGASSNTVKVIKTKNDLRRVIAKSFDDGWTQRSAFIEFSDSKFLSLLRLVYYSLIRKRPTTMTQNWCPEKGYIYLQKMLPNNDYDTRVTVIGGKAFAFRRYNRENDFRASGSGKICYEQDAIDKNAVRIAFECSKHFNFQTMAYDFLYDESGELVICEISYTFMSSVVYKCSGYWTDKMEFIVGNYNPEHFQLENFLDTKLRAIS